MPAEDADATRAVLSALLSAGRVVRAAKSKPKKAVSVSLPAAQPPPPAEELVELTKTVELVRTPLGLGLRLGDDGLGHCRVVAIGPDSQAGRSGAFAVHDRIVALNGHPLTSYASFKERLAAIAIGGKVRIEIAVEIAPAALAAIEDARSAGGAVGGAAGADQEAEAEAKARAAAKAKAEAKAMAEAKEAARRQAEAQRQARAAADAADAAQPIFIKGIRKAGVQPKLPYGWFLIEQLHGPSYYYHESWRVWQWDKPTAWVPHEESDSEDDFQRADEEYRRRYPYEHWAGNPY